MPTPWWPTTWQNKQTDATSGPAAYGTTPLVLGPKPGWLVPCGGFAQGFMVFLAIGAIPKRLISSVFYSK